MQWTSTRKLPPLKAKDTESAAAAPSAHAHATTDQSGAKAETDPDDVYMLMRKEADEKLSVHHLLSADYYYAPRAYAYLVGLVPLMKSKKLDVRKMSAAAFLRQWEVTPEMLQILVRGMPPPSVRPPSQARPRAPRRRCRRSASRPRPRQ